MPRQSVQSVVRVETLSNSQRQAAPEPWGGNFPRSYSLKSRVPRWNIPQSALALLERVFALERFPAQDIRQRLAQDMDVTPRQVGASSLGPALPPLCWPSAAAAAGS